jgi:hypothetical protein
MKSLMGIAFILLLRCDAECRHCGFEAGPTRTEEMQTRDVLRWLDEARALDICQACFVGGEPFLFKDLDKVVEKAGEFANVELVTNCGWAKDAKTAKERLISLQSKGLTMLWSSSDVFHQEYVPIDRVKNVLNAADSIGLHLGVQACKGGCQLTEEELRTRKTEFILREVEAVGRARNFPVEKHSVDFFENQEFGCLRPIPCGSVFPNGDVYLCDAGAIRIRDKKSPVYLGNALQAPLMPMLKKIRDDPFYIAWRNASWKAKCAVLRSHGLSNKLKAAPYRYQAPCDLCAHLLNDPDTREVLQKFYS